MKNALFALVLMLFLAACESGCNNVEPTKSKPIENNDIVVEPAIDSLDGFVTPEMEANIRFTLNEYLQAQSDGDFERLMNFAYPGIFTSEVEKQKQIDLMSGYHESGFQNKLIEHKIEFISPIVELDSNKIVLVKFDAKVDVVFTDKFVGKPENYGNMVKEKYGQNVVYDSLNTTYHAEGIQIMYAVTPHDSISFTWLAEGFARAASMADFITYDDLVKLRVYAQ